MTEPSVSQVLWPGGEQWLPFQVQDDSVEDGDPFVDMLAGLSAEMPPGGRVVTRVLLSERNRDWSERWRNQAIAGSGSANQLAVDAMRREESEALTAGRKKGDDADTDGQTRLVLLIGIAAVLLVAGVYLERIFSAVWNEHRVELFAFGTLGLLAIAGLGYLLRRTGILGALFGGRPEPKFYDPDQVRLRVSGAAFRLEVQLYALLDSAGEGADVMERALRPVVASYRRFDSPMGARFEEGPLERLSGFDPAADDLGFLGGRRRRWDSSEEARPGRESWARGRRQRCGMFRETRWTCPALRVREAGGCRSRRRCSRRSRGAGTGPRSSAWRRTATAGCASCAFPPRRCGRAG